MPDSYVPGHRMPQEYSDRERSWCFIVIVVVAVEAGATGPTRWPLLGVDCGGEGLPKV